MEASRFLPPQSCACGPEGVRPEAFCKYVFGLDPSETMAVQNEKLGPSSSGPEGSVSAPGWPMPTGSTTSIPMAAGSSGHCLADCRIRTIPGMRVVSQAGGMDRNTIKDGRLFILSLICRLCIEGRIQIQHHLACSPSFGKIWAAVCPQVQNISVSQVGKPLAQGTFRGFPFQGGFCESATMKVARLRLMRDRQCRDR